MAAEGITGHLDQAFLDAIYEVIAGWGIDAPAKAARFLTSHIHTDGGGDGHWHEVLGMVHRYIASETRLQQFLSVLTAAMESLEGSLNANIDELSVWSGPFVKATIHRA